MSSSSTKFDEKYEKQSSLSLKYDFENANSSQLGFLKR